MELDQGLQDLHNDQCVVINRHISGVYDNMDDMNANYYVDVTPSNPVQLNRRAQNNLMTIKTEMIPQKVDKMIFGKMYINFKIGSLRNHTYLFVSTSANDRAVCAICLRFEA